jgi:hypothetical protein
MDALTQRLFSDMFVESSYPKLRDRLVARAQKVDRKFREELFVDLICWDVTKSEDALKQIKVPPLVLAIDLRQLRAQTHARAGGYDEPWMDAIASRKLRSSPPLDTSP